MSDLKPEFTIEEMQPEDFEAANEVRLQSWLDTYVNNEAGVTRDWIEARNKIQRSPERVERRRKFGKGIKSAQWVAKNSAGTVFGVVGPYEDEEGIQHVGSLYVDKKYHGSGVGSALMQKIIEWSDPSKPIVLGVAAYNKRAITFYKKFGFIDQGHHYLMDNVIPCIDMIRRGDQE